MSISFDRSHMVLSAKLLDPNIEEQLKEMHFNEEQNPEDR